MIKETNLHKQQVAEPSSIEKTTVFPAGMAAVSDARITSLAALLRGVPFEPVKLLIALLRYRRDPGKLVDIFVREPGVRRAYLRTPAECVECYKEPILGSFAEHQDLARMIEAREAARDAVAQIRADDGL